MRGTAFQDAGLHPKRRLFGWQLVMALLSLGTPACNVVILGDGENQSGDSNAAAQTALLPPSALTYSDVPMILSQGQPVTIAASGLSGGAVDAFTVTPAFPPGISLNETTGEISGTPSAVAPIGAYTVTASNSAGDVSAQVHFGVGLRFTATATLGIGDSSPGDGFCVDASAGNACTLKAAIAEANAQAPNPAVIQLAAATYLLGAGGISLNNDITLSGVGSASSILDGQNAITPLTSQLGRRLSIAGVTVRNGRSAVNVDGGGLLLSGNNRVVIEDSVFQANVGQSSSGGAIGVGPFSSWVDLTLLRTQFLSNSSTSDSGGAISLGNNGRLRIEDSLFEANAAPGGAGGGIHSNFNPQVSVLRSTFKGNSAQLGGALAVGISFWGWDVVVQG